MGADYSQMGLDGRLRSVRSLATRDTAFVNGQKFESLFEAEGKRVRTSTLGMGTGAFVFSGNSAGTFNFADSNLITVQSALSWNPPKGRFPMFAVPYVGFWEGTVLTSPFQVWPDFGTTSVATQYDAFGAYDAMDRSGTTAVYTFGIKRIAGTSSQVMRYVVNWHYFNFTAGST